MNSDQPNLYRLFKRSCYRTLVVADGSGEPLPESEIRSERERFATAAVAFCFNHSTAFQQRFWDAICRGDGDPADAPDVTVAVEPVHWADLRLTVEGEQHQAVWVIEFKLDSDLAPKQDPTDAAAYCEPDRGYGTLFGKAENAANVDRRYVVLGSRRLSTGHGWIDPPGIRWQARRWSDLATAVAPAEDPLTTDLFDCLGKLGITAFRMRDIKDLIVAGDFRAAANAWEVLTAVRSEDCCGFNSSTCWLTVQTPVADHFNIGFFLSKPSPHRRTSDIHQGLDEVVGGSRGSPSLLAWAGYEAGPTVSGDGGRRSVWFYCASRDHVNRVRVKLQGSVAFADPVQEDGVDCVIAINRPGEQTSDLDWFWRVLRTAAT